MSEEPGRMYRGVAPGRRRAERRERLLAAALDEFTSTGYQATKIAELCSRAGVSTRNFYEEFRGKEDVLLALHARINDMAMVRVGVELGAVAEADVVTRIGKLVDVFVATVAVDPRLPRLNYVEAVGVSPALEAQHQEWVGRWADFICGEAERAAEDGIAPRRDYRLTAIALVGAVTGLLREWQAHDPPIPAAAIAEEMKGIMIAAITRKTDAP
ncbi:transcriptional regulator, TetR family [Amycolatopsis marina]|uniref:Transcriptional regulator, TetR family n=1 Tax=Amycolatopsis marina TaxID=490629 RepID=A0A1I1BJ53_9PSEU|nr:TetR/AcrR family transcriptional regulator [Amycolatopsis marina]SFB48808.1 transcriptional regulator, TetR family [Amycolatopsis marina]